MFSQITHLLNKSPDMESLCGVSVKYLAVERPDSIQREWLPLELHSTFQWPIWHPPFLFENTAFKCLTAVFINSPLSHSFSFLSPPPPVWTWSLAGLPLTPPLTDPCQWPPLAHHHLSRSPRRRPLSHSALSFRSEGSFRCCVCAAPAFFYGPPWGSPEPCGYSQPAVTSDFINSRAHRSALHRANYNNKQVCLRRETDRERERERERTFREFHRSRTLLFWGQNSTERKWRAEWQ